MTARYYSGRLYPSSLTADAGNINASYPVANLLKQALGRPWRSNTVAAINRAFLDFGSAIYIEAVVLVDVNVPAIQVHTGTSSTTEFSQADAARVLNPVTGRYHILVPVAATRRYVTLTMSVAQMTGLAYGSAGAVYSYATVTTLDKRPRYGFQETLVRPETFRPLANGGDMRLQTGTPYTRLEGQFKGPMGEDLMALSKLAQAETVFLDLDIENRPGMAWPVRLAEDQIQVRMEQFNRELVPFQFKEAV